MKREEKLWISMIILGLFLRIVAIINHEIMYDGTAYAAMGSSLAERGEFYMPWGVLWPPNGGPGYSHWCSPLYPAYLSMFYAILGYSAITTKLAGAILAVISVFVVWYTSHDLMGKKYGLMVTALISLDPLLILLGAYGFSENMVLLTFTLSMWAMLKGIKDERYLILAGIFGAMGYLSRSNVGYFFIIAAAIGLWWRVHYIGWSVLKNRYYLTAGGIFGLVFAIWTGRNIYRFGWPNWETNPMITEIVRYSLNHPLELTYAMVMKAILFAVFILTFASFFLPELNRKREEILADEKLSGMYLGIILPVVIAWFFMSSYHVYLLHNGPEKPIFWEEGARYVIISHVPMYWAVFYIHEHHPGMIGKSLRGLTAITGVIALWFINTLRGISILLGIAISGLNLRARAMILAVLLLTVSSLGALSIDHPAYVKACEYLDPILEENDTVALDIQPHPSIYMVHPYLPHLRTRPVFYSEGVNTTYIISWNNRSYENYTLIGEFHSSRGLLGISTIGIFAGPGAERDTVRVWKRV